MNPLISIIIPVYNAEKYLHRCLDSVIQQSYAHLEIILVNDGSTDNSKNICNEYAQKDSRIKLIEQENGGVSKARNTAIDIATGDYIHCVDADDWLEKDVYITLAQEISVLKSVDIIKFNAYNSNSIIIGAVPYNNVYDGSSIENISLEYIGSEKFGGLFILGVPWLYMIRKSLIDNNHIRFNENLHRCEDRLFIITNFLYAQKALFLDKAFYHYEIAENSLSNKYDKNRWNQEKMYLQELKKEYSSIKSDEFGNSADNRIINDSILRVVVSIDNIFFSINNNSFMQKYSEVKKIVSDSFLKNYFFNFRSNKLNQKLSITLRLVRYKQAFLLTFLNTIIVYKNKLLN